MKSHQLGKLKRKHEIKLFETKLIFAVKNHHCLYVKDDIGYNNKLQRQAAWEEIAFNLDRTVEECQKKWASLRDSFRSYYKTETTTPVGPGSTGIIKWVHYQKLRFLEPHVRIVVENVCRGEAPGNEPECSLYPTNDTFVTPSNDDPLLNNSCASQISNDSSGITFNPIQPKLEAMECQLSPEILPYPNNQQDNELLNEENQLKLNIIEVLLLIKYNKKLLFDNENQRSIEMWTKILKKAQSLDLAPSNVSWSYARDSLYAAWRLHTIQKKDAIEAGDVSTKYNIVDLSILQIENDPIETDSTMFEINETTTSVKKKSPSVVKTNSSSTQTTDEMYQADLRMKLLQCEALEIENYKRRLDVFELERKLQILPSKFTDKFVQPAQSSEKSSNGHLRDGEQKNVPKIELDA